MPRIAVSIGCAVAALALITGCTVADEPDPPVTPGSPTAAPTGPTAEPEPEPEPDPEFVPDGTAEQNVTFARFVVQQRADAADGALASGEIAAALIDGGFATDVIEVTADRTPLGLAVDVITFGVRLGDECIVGELRGGAVTATTAAVLETGRCLVGSDASIG